MLEPRCLCGKLMELPEGQTKARCQTCGVYWEKGPEGYWAYGYRSMIFTPLFSKDIKPKPNHYQKQMAWRNRHRKAVKRC